jgi:UDP-N-acetylmuramoyl-tripeptide--D-alanyl-D-alanine ligase
MFQRIKKYLYFPVASYFRFFASIRLKRWHPRIVVITGSSGKTTLLHLVESQLGGKAKYSHEANSSFGIPFDILDIHRRDLTFVEWPAIFILPWINVWKSVPKEEIYIIEADCDRPYEGRFLSEFLKPEVTLWTNVSRTHSMNFDGLVARGKFGRVEEAIAYEYGYFAEETRKLLLIPADSILILRQVGRVKCKVEKVESSKKPSEYTSRYLLPKATATSFEMCLRLTDYLGVKPDKTFSKFKLPPGRSSVFKGIRGITIIDSTYNANLDSMAEIITMFAGIEAGNKWVVLGDMLEQGKEEKEEHEKLAKLILKYKFDKVILMGPRITKYTKPLLPSDTISFLGPKEVLDYLQANIKGGETILFKGARFLEGVIENLLLDKKDISRLVRREKIWEIRRKKWGL